MKKAKTRVGVLIPAAGTGSRLGGKRKQFRDLGGKPVLIRSAEVFTRCPSVAQIVVAVPARDRSAAEQALAAQAWNTPVRVVAGGESRQASVGEALRALDPAVNVVLVHDAVRPFVQSDHVRCLVDAIIRYRAAALAIPVVDTLRAGSEGTFLQRRDREGLFRMQTPQGALRSVMEQAHQNAAETGYLATDEVELLQRIGESVRIVSGDPINVKITTPSDWEFAHGIWDFWSSNREEHA